MSIVENLNNYYENMLILSKDMNISWYGPVLHSRTSALGLVMLKVLCVKVYAVRKISNSFFSAEKEKI